MGEEVKYLGPKGLDTLISSIVEAYAKLVDDMLPSLTSNSTILSNSANGVIKGINVAGKSEQKTTQTLATVQGAIAPSIGSLINQGITSNATRCISDVVEVPIGTVNAPSGFEVYGMHSTSASGSIDEVYAWASSISISKSGFYRFIVRRASGANLTPSDFVLVANVSPTPANPIPIIDASGDVTALDDKILTNEITVGKNWSGSTDATCTISEFTVEGGKEYQFDVADALPSVTAIRVVWKAVKGSTYISYVDVNANRSIIAPTDATICTVQFKASASPSADVVRKVRVYTQSNTITLPFSPKSVGSVANELIVNEDGSGKIVQRVYGAVFDGSDDEEWGMDYGSGMFATPSSGDNVQPIGASSANPISTNFVFNGAQSGMYANLKDGEFGIQFLMHCARVFCKYLAKTSVAEWKAWLSQNPITVYYQLATPIVTDLTPEEVASILALRTYNGTTVIESEMDVVSVSYYKNTDIGSAIGEVSTRAVENSNAIAEVNDRVDGLEQLINNLDILDEEEF